MSRKTEEVNYIPLRFIWYIETIIIIYIGHCTQNLIRRDGDGYCMSTFRYKKLFIFWIFVTLILVDVAHNFWNVGL